MVESGRLPGFPKLSFPGFAGREQKVAVSGIQSKPPISWEVQRNEIGGFMNEIQQHVRIAAE
jgi:hypothetical protein